MLVEFTDAATRELILSYARNLASYIDDEGKPTAGIRMQIPDFLEREFKLLENYGYQMRRHGVGTRRIIKYDIIERNLMLSYKPPNSEEWTRITPQMAQLRKARDNQVNLREYESQLSPPSNLQTTRTSTQHLPPSSNSQTH